MSHFTVLVVGDNVEKALQPYHEYECTGVKDEFVVWVDKHDEVDEVYKKSDEGEYNDIDHCGREYFGYTDIVNGRIGTHTNPNAKWDWWQIGGRWAGDLLLKKDIDVNFKITKPNFSWGWNAEEKAKILEKPVVDSAPKKYIDIEGMEKPMATRAAKQWDEWHSKIKGLPEGDEAVKKWMQENLGFLVMKKDIKRLHDMNREEYIACKSIWAPFAVLWAGKWYEKGEMGWFGISINEDSNWNGQFKELWSEIPDEEIITMVDCHI